MALRILVADDHEVVRRGLCALLDAHDGWKVCAEASDGRDAVEKAKQLRPDIVILDIGMPSLNGLAAARQILQRAQARRFCSADDVMIGRYGPPLFQILRGLEGAYNVALMKAVPDESKLSRDFLFYFLKHSSILQYVIYHSQRAAGQIGLTKETLEP